MKNKFLYSQGTMLAYKIDEKYYGKKHYVWCCDLPHYGIDQPLSSDPIERCQNLLTSIYTKDRHSYMVDDNKNGIKRGALFNKKQNIISEEEVR